MLRVFNRLLYAVSTQPTFEVLGKLGGAALDVAALARVAVRAGVQLAARLERGEERREQALRLGVANG